MMVDNIKMMEDDMKTITGIRKNRYTESEELILHKGEKVYVRGSVYKIRKMKGFAFVLIRTSREIIQCVYSPEEAKFPLSLIKEECW